MTQFNNLLSVDIYSPWCLPCNVGEPVNTVLLALDIVAGVGRGFRLRRHELMLPTLETFSKDYCLMTHINILY